MVRVRVRVRFAFRSLRVSFTGYNHAASFSVWGERERERELMLYLIWLRGRVRERFEATERCRMGVEWGSDGWQMGWGPR